MTDQLAAATSRRVNLTRQRARDTLRQLDRQGSTINYVTVARAAGVSRSLLYRDPELRKEIQRLRDLPATSPRPPANQRMSQASRDELVRTLREEIRLLRDENQALHQQLANQLGRRRATRPATSN